MPRLKSEGKRQEILDAAEAAFGRREFDEVTTDDIAAGAGVGKGTLYRYFPTKEDLYAATLLRVLAELDAGLERPCSECRTASRRLEAICRVMLRTLWARHTLFHALHGLGRSSGTLRREFRVRRSHLQRMVEQTLRDGIERGELRAHDPFTAAQLFLGMVRSGVVFRRPGDTADGVAREILDVFLRGVGTQEAP